MKKLVFAIIILFSVSLSIAQDTQLFDKLAVSFSNNDSKAISQNFAPNLDLSIGSADGTYSKQQASMILSEFFAKNKVTVFTVNHVGSSNELTKYAIAEMETSLKSYSVYILVNSNKKITQLQIEQE